MTEREPSKLVSFITGTAERILKWGGLKRAPEARVGSSVWRHPPPENFEI